MIMFCQFLLLYSYLLSDHRSVRADFHMTLVLIYCKDNYQGEESDIVLVSLTRSNSNRDIGFMSSKERLNVMLSRARNSLIMIGNSRTFESAKKGKEAWVSLFDSLRQNGAFFNGFPVRCEQHPERTAVLQSEDQFDQFVPDGGCDQPWWIPSGILFF
jgi:hypothetical protein